MSRSQKNCADPKIQLFTATMPITSAQVMGTPTAQLIVAVLVFSIHNKQPNDVCLTL